MASYQDLLGKKKALEQQLATVEDEINRVFESVGYNQWLKDFTGNFPPPRRLHHRQPRITDARTAEKTAVVLCYMLENGHYQNAPIARRDLRPIANNGTGLYSVLSGPLGLQSYNIVDCETVWRLRDRFLEESSEDAKANGAELQRCVPYHYSGPLSILYHRKSRTTDGYFVKEREPGVLYLSFLDRLIDMGRQIGVLNES